MKNSIFVSRNFDSSFAKQSFETLYILQQKCRNAFRKRAGSYREGHYLMGTRASCCATGRTSCLRRRRICINQLSGKACHCYKGQIPVPAALTAVSRNGTMGFEAWISILANRSRRSFKHRYGADEIQNKRWYHHSATNLEMQFAGS